MPNVPVTANQFDAGVYQIETNDPVVGGAAGISNKQAINLANRTAFLKAAIDAVIAGEGGFPDNADPTLLYAAIQSAISAGAAALPAVVTQASAETGTSTIARLWTPERIKQAIAALVSLRAQSTTAQALAGTDTKTDMSPARVKEAMDALLSVQTWVNETANRALNTSYVNTSGQPIGLSAMFGLGVSGNAAVEIVVDGAVIAQHGVTGSLYLSSFIIIPSGSTYYMNPLHPSISIYKWLELK